MDAWGVRGVSKMTPHALPVSRDSRKATVSLTWWAELRASDAGRTRAQSEGPLEARGALAETAGAARRKSALLA